MSTAELKLALYKAGMDPQTFFDKGVMRHELRMARKSGQKVNAAKRPRDEGAAASLSAACPVSPRDLMPPPTSSSLTAITHEELVVRLNVALDAGDAENAVSLAAQIANRRGQMNKKQKVMDYVQSAKLVRQTVLDNLNEGLFADMKKSLFRDSEVMLQKTHEIIHSWQSRMKRFDHRLMSQIELLDGLPADACSDNETFEQKSETSQQLHDLLNRVKEILRLLNGSKELLNVVHNGMD